MTNDVSVRMTSRHQAQLLDHLFPGDGREAVAIAFCGHSEGPTRNTLLVQQIELVPYSICHRVTDFITWPTDYILPLLDRAAEQGLRSTIRYLSHPGDFRSSPGKMIVLIEASSLCLELDRRRSYERQCGGLAWRTHVWEGRGSERLVSPALLCRSDR